MKVPDVRSYTQNPFKDVIKAGTAVDEGLAIGAPFAELIPMFAFIGKREQTRAFEDFVNTAMKAQHLD